jgi:colanic acid/amylovoran biosynthesis glycosyltransferase
MTDREKPVVAHTVIPWLPRSGSWIHAQVARLERWRAIALTKRIENREVFPFEPVYSVSELSAPARLAERLEKKRRGYYPLWRRKIEEHGARLIHSHFGNWGWEDLPLKRALGLPQVSSFYGADVWKLGMREEWRARYREYFATGDRFLVEGNAMRRRVIELGCPPEKVLVHHLGVDLARIAFQPRRPGPDGVVRFLAAGRMVGTKGHDLAVRAFAKVHRRNPRTRLGLILIPPERRAEQALEPVRAAIAEERIADAVALHGYMPYPEYLAALASYHVFLQPSRHLPDGDAEGGAPVAMIEMSAAGLPVVGSIHCDIPEVILDGVSGLLFPEGDVEAMAEAMLRLASEPERWPDMGAAGRAHVEREYNAALQTPRLERIYDTMPMN